MLHAVRRFVADYVMLIGGIVVGGGWLAMSSEYSPAIILAGVGIAFAGFLLDPRSRWRAAVLLGIATAWIYVGVGVLIGLAVARLVRPGRAQT